MSVMIVDAEQATKFEQVDGITRIMTQEGRFVGNFYPAQGPTIQIDPPISDAELARITADGGYRLLADILADRKVG